MALGQIYNTGTVTVTNGSVTVTGAGVIWNDVIDGDTLQVGTTQAFILSVDTGLTVITLKAPWAGTTAASAPYMILKNSWERYDPAITQSWVRDMLQKINAAGVIYSVATTPNPDIGNNGDYALRTNSPEWTLWLKVGGTWVLQGDLREPHGVQQNVAWNTSMEVCQIPTDFLTNNVARNIVDGWEGMFKHATASIWSTQTAASREFPQCCYFSNAANFSAPASGDFVKFRHKIEGYRIAHWGWGGDSGLMPGSVASPIVVAFRYYNQLGPGTIFAKLSNADQSRCYYHEFAIVNNWNYVAFNVPPDTAGTWNKSNGVGLTFEIFADGKEAAPVVALDAWGTFNKVQTFNATSNLFNTAGNAFAITGVFISAGTQLPLVSDLPKLMRPYDEEVLTCMRYFYNGIPALVGAVYSPTTVVARAMAYHPVPMRVAPAVLMTSPVSFLSGTVVSAATTITSNYSTAIKAELDFTLASGIQYNGAVAVVYAGGGGNINFDARM
jgi:hypothetical protein